MAFPGRYDFNYYRGDTFSFIIRPKDASGNPFDITSSTTAVMTVANRRGPAGNIPFARLAYTAAQGIIATPDPTDNIITCTITPTGGRNLTTDTTWVYDVQVTLGATVYTLLNGNITVTDDVSGAA